MFERGLMKAPDGIQLTGLKRARGGEEEGVGQRERGKWKNNEQLIVNQTRGNAHGRSPGPRHPCAGRSI